jgi:hypothetical protein
MRFVGPARGIGRGKPNIPLRCFGKIKIGNRKKCITYFYIETHTSKPISRNTRKWLKSGSVSKFSGCPDAACAAITNISYAQYFLNQLFCSQND